ncbi:MAG TPA: carboxypeptidase-like regulatory domain-containing protein [Pyrinomonadaceae bacterium]|nr:carboxypeptidase-like regulatory domain-containing protein [Pyrinomonadaceae bacterium]
MKSSTRPDDVRGATRLFFCCCALASALALACILSGATLAAGARAKDATTTAARMSRQTRGAATTPTPKPSPANTTPHRSNVRGRVIYADTSRPLRRATVRLMRIPEQREVENERTEAEAEELHTGLLKTTVTNRRGEFLFVGLRAGKYFVSVDAPGIIGSGRGFVIGRFGVMSQSGSGSYAIVDVDGVNDVTTEVRALPGASISGRVTYADGEPATNVVVVLFARKGDAASRLIRETIAVDDRGRYRIEGLAPGEYLLGASELHTAFDDTGKSNMFNAATTVGAYHPSAINMGSAVPVNVEAGAEVEDIDIMFPAGELRRVSGVVRWSKGATPVNQALVKLQHVEEPNTDMDFSDLARSGLNVGLAPRAEMMFFGLLSRNVQLRETDEQGQWAFSDVTEGNYILTVIAPLPERKRTHLYSTDGTSSHVPPGVVQKRLPVVVRNGDVSGFNVTLGEGGRVSGTVTVEGETRALAPAIHVGALTAGDEPLFKLPQPVRPDGTFEIEGLTPGEVFLDVIPPDSKLYVKSITAPNGVDLMRSPLVIGEETSTTGVRILLAADGATITGRAISSTDGSPVGGALLLLLPADPALRYSRASRASTRTGLDGSFVLHCAPGTYHLLTWHPDEEPENPAHLLDTTSAQTLTLRPNERRTLDARIGAPAAREP